MNFASVRAVRTATLIILVCGLKAAASTGGDEYVSQPCLEKGGKRVLYAHGASDESGYGDAVIALDVATGKAQTLIPADSPDQQKPSEPLFKGCVPLKPVKLSDVGLSGSSATPEEDKKPKVYDAKDFSDDAFLFRAVQRQVLNVTSKDSSVLSLPYNVCYGTQMPGQLTAYVMPGKPFVALSFLFNGQCCCGGSISATVLLLPNLLDANAKLPKRAAAKASTEIKVEPPLVPYDRMLNDIGMALYRAGRLKGAAEYFKDAYEWSKYQKAPYLLTQFNRAAALAKAGEKKDALDALAILFSYEKERARFREKVKKDKDFDALRSDPDFQKLMTVEDCCVNSISDRSTESFRSRTEWWWREGESVMHLDEGWSWGTKKVHEIHEDGSSKSWYETGVLRSESFVKNGTGWARHYNEDGTLSFQEQWVNGVKVGPDAGLLP